MLTNESIIAALSSEGDKPHKSSSSHKSAAVTNQVSDKLCPVCDESAHKYKTRSGAEGISKRIKDCPGFMTALDDQKQEMIKKLKAKNPVCPKCSSWSHQGEDCN